MIVITLIIMNIAITAAIIIYATMLMEEFSYY